jgi:hypothetical protein
MTKVIADALGRLPPLWATEARDTEDIVLPLRLTCRWHRLTWYPVERDEDIVFGLTLTTLPQWRHFHLDELVRPYGGHAVKLDPAHVAMRAPHVPEVALHCFDDLAPFTPSTPRMAGL